MDLGLDAAHGAADGAELHVAPRRPAPGTATLAHPVDLDDPDEEGSSFMRHSYLDSTPSKSLASTTSTVGPVAWLPGCTMGKEK